MKDLIYSVNIELSGNLPEWVELIPCGPNVVGRDGRVFVFGPAEAEVVCRRFAEHGAPLPVDWEHATEVAAPEGKEAPAAGWVNKLEIRAGALWGNVDWTPRARQQISDKEYRFLSPVFSLTKTDRRIQVLHSVGLTNTPNLRLTALNRRQARNMEDDTMKKALCRLLGLPETATDQEIEHAAKQLAADKNKALNRAMPDGLPAALGLNAGATPDQVLAAAKDATAKAANRAESKIDPEPGVDLSRYVPRTDYDMAMNRASTAEGELEKIKAESLDEEIDKAVNKAMAEGKIAPASKDYYVSMCRKEGGLKEFQKFADSAPPVIADPKLPEKPGDSEKAMNREESEIAEMFGNTAEDLAKYTT